MSQKQVVAVVGALLVIVGAFAPFTDTSRGTHSLFTFDPEGGLIQAALGVGALVFTYRRQRRFGAFAGAVTLFLVAKLFVADSFSSVALRGNDTSSQVHYRWGLGAAVIGAVLLLIIGVMPEKSPPAPPPAG